MNKELAKIFDEVYPIGSIYAFLNNISKEEGIKMLESISGKWEYFGMDINNIYFKRAK